MTKGNSILDGLIDPDIAKRLTDTAVRLQRARNDEIRWPVGCHSPESCDRYRKCMYVFCHYAGNDIPVLTRPKL